MSHSNEVEHRLTRAEAARRNQAHFNDEVTDAIHDLRDSTIKRFERIEAHAQKVERRTNSAIIGTVLVLLYIAPKKALSLAELLVGLF